tara:strand:+ start:514 stop:759 length:246 start_codon:yes stop_codon:yes gene_type:complete
MSNICARLQEAQDLYERAGVDGRHGAILMIDAQARIAELEAKLKDALDMLDATGVDDWVKQYFEPLGFIDIPKNALKGEET